MNCNHFFIRINDVTKPRGGIQNQISWSGLVAGASAGCVHCGEVRIVFEDGEMRKHTPGKNYDSNDS